MVRRAALSLVLFTAGCVGAIGDGEAEPNAESPGAPKPGVAPSEPRSLPLRPLTAFELTNTIEDLYGDRASELSALSPSRLRAPSETMVSSETIWSGARADALEDAMYRVALRITAKLPDSFVETELPRIYRRAVTAEEIETIAALARDLEPKLGKGEARARAMQAALLSPAFLYLTSFGEGSDELTGGELASRLSYLLWASTPDPELLASAARGDLRDHLEREVRRMLVDPRSARGMARFVRNWTGIINLPSITRSDSAWTRALESDALGETDRYVAAWFGGSSRSFGELLTGTTTFVTPSLAAFYGAPISGEGFQAMPMPKERVGLLTQASFLAMHAMESASSPTLRGKWFMERGLCQGMGAPPANAVAMAPTFEPSMQTRDWHEALENTKGCAACHSRMEPPGYVFEGFDAIGRARATEKGRPVRTDAKLATGSDMDLSFTGPHDFARAAGQSAAVRTCFSTHLLGYAFGRDINGDDAALATAVSTALATDVREAVVILATSKAFRRATGAKS